jgi:AhpD family alkylhydroperoxidase
MSEHEGSDTDVGKTATEHGPFVTIVGKTATEWLGLIPHMIPLASAIGPFGLEPRLRELVVLAVLTGRGCALCEGVHRRIGKIAGLTELEVDGDWSGLTAAERAALKLALGTVSRLPDEMEADGADHHFTSYQIRQIRAVAIAAEARCNAGRAAMSLIGLG